MSGAVVICARADPHLKLLPEEKKRTKNGALAPLWFRLISEGQCSALPGG